MTPPLFWSRAPSQPGWQSYVLSPLALIYAKSTATRVEKSGYKASVPVICIGNINVGGTGKTPTTIALAQRLLARGKNVHIVSKGYGGKLEGPVQVKEQTHRAADVGDEPLLTAAFAPTWVAKDRAAGVKMAEENSADVILLDDGMQNPSVHKDLTITVVDAWRGFGNGCVLPAGPLREPVAAGLQRTDVLLRIGSDAAQDKFDKVWAGLGSISIAKAQLEPLETGQDWHGLRALAFAGIGHPEKFFTTLRGLGSELLRAEALRDHQPLTSALMKRLEIEALSLGAHMVTTEKDAVRLPRDFRSKVITLPVRLAVADWSTIDKRLSELGLD